MSAGLTVHSSMFGARVLGVPLSAATFTRPTFEVAPVEIEASLQQVWDVLRDFPRYPEWNPLNREVVVSGDGSVGSAARLGVSWGPYSVNGEPAVAASLATHLTNTESISIMEPPYALAWADKIGFVHRAERIQYLTPLENGHTLYRTDEVMVGLLSPLIARIYRRRILAGFSAAGEALKRRVEQR